MQSISHEELTKSVKKFHRYIFWAAGIVLLVYFIWFGLIVKHPLSKAPDTWGQFGDFIGGIFNPLIAYAAFHWITRSVLIQGKELADTRTALLAAARAQSEQALHSSLALNLSLIRAKIDSAETNIELISRDIEFVAGQYAKNGIQYELYTLDGRRLQGSEAMPYIADSHESLKECLSERKQLLLEMETCIKQASTEI
ncbi:hypothetical protein [Undibacterium sp.]|uniref:hypothetical protein n=1 Tax=Undibacterium sp. TaxID=1914977 RepID=UPI0037510C73